MSDWSSDVCSSDLMFFIGDRLDPEGNDYPVKVLGVPCHAVTGWRDTAEFVTALAGDLAAAKGE